MPVSFFIYTLIIYMIIRRNDFLTFRKNLCLSTFLDFGGVFNEYMFRAVNNDGDSDDDGNHDSGAGEHARSIFNVSLEANFAL